MKTIENHSTTRHEHLTTTRHQQQQKQQEQQQDTSAGSAHTSISEVLPTVHAVRSYMTESVQIEISMLSIAYMPFVPTYRKNTQIIMLSRHSC